MKTIGRTIILALALACTATAVAADEAKPAKKWEYKILMKSDVFAAIHKARDGKNDDTVMEKTTEKILNDLGAKGWELVTIDNGAYVFKRPSQKPATK